MAPLTTHARRLAQRRFTGCFHLLALLFAGLLSSAVDLPAQATTSREYQLKAVFLYNFTQFTDWPPDAFPTPQSPLVIGVLGKDPFGAYLDEAVRGEKVNDRALVVQRFVRVEDAKDCHVLFISQSEASRVEQVLRDLQSRSILTVSDINGFDEHGGMIQFMTRNNKIQLQVNMDALKTARLTMSSKLLRSAQIVGVKEP